MERITLAKHIAKEVGTELLSNYWRKQKGNTTGKKGISHGWVTQGDLKSDAMIVKAIKQAFPRDGIISEESDSTKTESGIIWIIDPIDGTTNFSRGGYNWSIAIAYITKDDVQGCVIYAPALNLFYYAEKGKGAYEESMHGTTKLDVSTKDTIENAIAHFNAGFEDKPNHEILKNNMDKLWQFRYRMEESAQLEFAKIAAGVSDYYLSHAELPWDHAAGALLIQEAGGKVTTWGKDIYIPTENGILATNKHLHQKIIKTLGDLYAR